MTTDTESAHDGRRTDDREELTKLEIEGVRPEDVTGDLLDEMAEVASDHGLAIDGISVGRTDE